MERQVRHSTSFSGAGGGFEVEGRPRMEPRKLEGFWADFAIEAVDSGFSCRGRGTCDADLILRVVV